MLSASYKNQITFWINSIPKACCVLFEDGTDLCDGEILSEIICKIYSIESVPCLDSETSAIGYVYRLRQLIPQQLNL